MGMKITYVIEILIINLVKDSDLVRGATPVCDRAMQIVFSWVDTSNNVIRAGDDAACFFRRAAAAISIHLLDMFEL